MNAVWGFIWEFWAILGEMSPYLLLGFLVAGLLSVLIRPESIERHLGGGRVMSVIKAAAFGVPLPLCSCGVIPVAGSLRRHGAGRGATTAFLISTPETGVDSILVTFSLLGAVFAVFRVAAALVSGILGGLLVDWLDREEPTQPGQARVCNDPCCAGGATGGKLRRALAYGFVALPRDIGKYLLIGLVLAALIWALAPANFLAQHVAPGLGQMLVMLALGIPIYVCATASVPIAAALILHAGVSPGAALVFLMTGPATNAATILTIYHTMGRRTALLYLLSVALAALACGLLMDALFGGIGVSAQPGGTWEMPALIQDACAAILLGILACAILIRPRVHREVVIDTALPSRPADRLARVVLKVSGMTCAHCRLNVHAAILACPGVLSAHVDLETGIAHAHGQDLDAQAICQSVQNAGFEAQEHRHEDGDECENCKGP